MKRNFAIVAISLLFTLGFADDAVPYRENSVEIVLQKPDCEASAAIVILHGARNKEGAKGIPQANFDYWLNKGYAVAALSMPGFGGSTGEKDFCGPFTIDSLNCALDTVKSALGVSKIAITGYGQGSTAALLLSTQRSDIVGITCSNGVYDLYRHNTPNDPLFTSLKEKGYHFDYKNEEEVFFRSPMAHIPEISSAVFIVHRKDNPVVSEEEAMDFYQQMLAAGKECQLVILDVANDSSFTSKEAVPFNEMIVESGSWLDELMVR